MQILRANNDHIIDIERLEKERFDDFYSIKTLRADIENPNNFVYLIFDNEKIAGYINVFVIFDEANIQRIAVFSEYEGKGYAKHLLEYTENEIKSHGVNKIYLEVSELNKRAINFYKENGYIETNRRKKYYKDMSDAIIMWKFF